MAKRKHRRRRRSRRRGRSSSLLRFWPAALVLLLAVAGIAWWISKTPATGETQGAECALVIDRTGSSNGDVTVGRYKELARKTVQGCRELHGRLSVYYFDQASPKLVLVNDKAYDLFLPVGRSQTKQEGQLDQLIQDAQDATDSVFDKPSGNARGSDILTAMAAATDNLNHDAARDGVSAKYLTVLTDGIQLSDDVSVSTLKPDAPASALKDAAKKVNAIPQLQGTQVSMVGVRSGTAEGGQQVPPWFDAKVGEFWSDVITDGGGKLCSYVPDATHLPVSCS